MKIEIQASVSTKIGYASQQNSVPVLRELKLVNTEGNAATDLTLKLSSDPAFLAEKIWRIDRIDPESTFHIPDRDVRLSAGYLGALNEAVRGTVVLELTAGAAVLASEATAVEVLARSEWGGATSMAELLPAFVMPNDPAIDKILKMTAEILRKGGQPDGLNGYESKSRKRVWTMLSALWSAVASLRLSYVLPPASFETAGQKIRLPTHILDGRVATCLDTATLFAAAIEQMGLNAVIVLTKGHAFAGAWLAPKEFADISIDDPEPLRKRIDLDEIVVFETTYVGQSQVPPFSKAIEEAKRQVAIDVEGDFGAVIDIRRARMRKIRPLDTQVAAVGASGDAPPTEDAPLALDAAPDMVDDIVDVAVAKPATDALTDRIGVWQRKLLDLSTRNRLLNLPDGSSSIPLLCPDPARLEDKLAAGQSIRVMPLPDLGAAGRDTELYDRQRQTRLREDVAREYIERGDILCDLDPKRFDAAIVELYRKAKADLNEGGANTLYLALGFLRWRKNESDKRVNRAPLILMPVRLERRSARSGYTLRAHEDEARINLTLLELLRQDFALDVGPLSGPLPADDNGIDVAKVWNAVRHAVRDSKGFEVSTDVVLGTFSFAKFLMWKDLADRIGQLRESPVVRHLLDRRNEPYAGKRDHVRPEELDDRVDPASLFLPLPADSSQISAVVASAEGMSFVLDGPPGTGKSQTIANMIAQNLALGRRILFVAEKRAALDVVHRRLKAKGLGEFCLELHSNKATKVAVLDQLDAAWSVAERYTAEEWKQETERLRRLRDGLNALVRALHRRAPNGLTLHDAIGRVVGHGEAPIPELGWPDGTAHTAEDIAKLRETVRRLQANAAPIAGVLTPLAGLRRTTWSNAWQAEIVAAARRMSDAARSYDDATAKADAALGLPLDWSNFGNARKAIALFEALAGAYGIDLSFAFAPDAAAKLVVGEKAVAAIEAYRAAEKRLSAAYMPEAVRRIDRAGLRAKWNKANGQVWPLSAFGKRATAKLVQAQGGANVAPNVGADLDVFDELAARLAEIDVLTAEAAGIPGWSGLTSDTARMRAALAAGKRLRDAVAVLAGDASALSALRQAVARVAIDANELLGETGQIRIVLTALKAAVEDGASAAEGLARLSEFETTDDLAGLRALAAAIADNQTQLNAWCAWRRAKSEATSLGLAPLAAIAEADPNGIGRLDRLFEVAYARWFAAKTMDEDPIVRDFVAAEHIGKIEDFRALDDRLADLSVRYIRAGLAKDIPRKQASGKGDGYDVLRHQLQLQKRHKPIRQLVSDMGPAFTRLAPCMLMSPLSIAQYLPPEKALFDLVIFDEASQISPWDAIGAIARGKQVVIAGDHRQMPPTSFFTRGASPVDDDVEEDMESILDECKAAGLPNIPLTWHYRSRHESLIAFSNERYYGGGLVTFPAPVTKRSAVSWRKVDGVYSKGKDHTNPIEARTLADEVVARLKRNVASGAEETIAVVTLNAEQQALVEDLLDKGRRAHPEIEPFFDEALAEPVVVKNLETVQGDERDVVLLGIGFGPTTPGSPTMSMNFGPLNREGGWRRLNVAVTRARREMVVFTSFTSSMIDLHRTGARAVADLKHFIEFSERGPVALAAASKGSMGDHESPFESAVAEELRRLGWQVVPQIGVSRFRIDLGIVHPDKPGDFLVGVECDGAMYHSGATARDRDKIRAAILADLGWKLVRIWSTDWWFDRRTALRKVHDDITRLLVEARANAEAEAAARISEGDAGAASAAENAVAADSVSGDPAAVRDDGGGESRREVGIAKRAYDAGGAAPGGTEHLSSEAPVQPPGTYRRAAATDLDLTLDRDRFEEASYAPTLSALIHRILTIEAPMRDDALVERVSRLHGFQRSGDRIRERVLKFAKKKHPIRKDPVGGKFVWLDDAQVSGGMIARRPAAEEDGRRIEDIASEEIRAAAAHVAGGDIPVEIARFFGIKRLSADARDRITDALDD
ncbi:MAG: DUF3320 domain-containing protein [Tagaea sp.]|nr:DUF3320 domain-containing protein [Tagaea sp.]